MLYILIVEHAHQPTMEAAHKGHLISPLKGLLCLQHEELTLRRMFHRRL